jgi:hypothetical protein
MIKFLRKIRQNLLTEGKTFKYFKYAIGETVPFVIGILIVLKSIPGLKIGFTTNLKSGRSNGYFFVPHIMLSNIVFATP